ncbi:MAG: substrate-binding domain-containing protein [Clostridium sp.]|nr:substrate-binding domain-containing protein [Clostridium sp.]
MKKLISLLMVCMLMFTTLGCSDSNSKSSSSGNIKVFASIASSEGFIGQILDGMKSSAAENNVELDIEKADNDVETQVSQIKEAKGKGYDVIVCFLVDRDTSQQIINEAGDTPIVFFNAEPDENRLKSDKYIFVASNEDEVVDNTVEYLKQYFKGKKTFNAVLLEGERTSNATIVRTDTLKTKLKKEGFDINYVFQDEAKWDRRQAKEMFKTFLKLGKEYDAVICNNDEMALGVVDAMEEEGVEPSSVPILGVDAIEDACEAIIDGKMAFTLKQSGEGQGESIIKAAKSIKNGEKISKLEYADESGKYIWYPYSKVDKSNASEYIK